MFEIRFELGLAGFDLAVELASAARTLGVFGPSGAGKTSLLETVAGWRKPSYGRIAVAGRVLLDRERTIDLSLPERGIGYVPQDLLLFPDRSVRENVLFGPRAGLGLFGRAVEILELGALLERDCSTLSGGERQRVALARALCSEPRLLLLDEPLRALDLPLRGRILPYLLRIRDEFHLPTLFVSHDPTEVQALCDEVVVLERGSLRAQGIPAQVLRPQLTGLPTFENLFEGEIETLEGGLAVARIAPGARVLLAPVSLKPAERVLVALAADDILVSISRPAEISARNCLQAAVSSIRAEGSAAWLEARVGTPEESMLMVVALTPAAIQELRLAVGAPIYLVFKTSACRVLARPA